MHTHTHTHTHLRVGEALLNFRPSQEQLHHEEHAHHLTHLKDEELFQLLVPQLHVHLVINTTKFKGRVVSIKWHAVLVLYHFAAEYRDVSACGLPQREGGGGGFITCTDIHVL